MDSRKKRKMKRRRRNLFPVIAAELFVILLLVMLIFHFNRDTDAPVIQGAVDRTFTIGEPVLYRSGVSALDTQDGQIDFEVDNSKVVPSEAGSYPVVYSAVDSAGNRTEITVTFSFEEPPTEPTTEPTTAPTATLNDTLEPLAQKVYGEIVTEDMTDEQKARAIWTWVHNNIAYTGKSEKVDWQDGATTAFQTLGGDCFAYFTAAKALLVKAQIETIDVYKIKKEGRSNHYWLLIQIEGNWYHFDACPRKGAGSHTFFMYTDEQMLEFSEKNKDCFDFDLRLYPRTPGEIADRFLKPFYPEWFDSDGNRLVDSNGNKAGTAGYAP